VLRSRCAPTPGLILPLGGTVPAVGEELRVEGYPQQVGPSQEVQARATTSALIDSRSLRTPQGERLFLSGIQVIPVDLTIYGGMSGAPLVRAGRAVGVMSASLNEGGAIGWAIPMKYIEQMTRIGGLPPHEVEWPELTLLSSAFRAAQRTVRVDEAGERLLQQYLGDVGDVMRVYDELHLCTTEVQASVVANRMILRRVRNNLESYTKETVGELLEGSVFSLLDILERFAALNNQHTEAMRGIVSGLSRLSEWAGEGGSVPRSTSMAIDREVAMVNQRYADLEGGYHAAIGADPDDLDEFMGTAMDFFVLAKRGELAPALEALARFLEAANAAAGPYTGARAVEFASRDVARWRAIGAAFEPAVYRQN
jgi:hypothetical protein